LIARIRTGQGGWHNDVVRLVGHLVSIGAADAVILGLAEALTLPGYTAEATRRDLQKMIDGARSKGWTPGSSSSAATDPAADDDGGVGEWNAATIDDTPIPPRGWLLGVILCRKVAASLIADGAVGKTTLGLAQALELATGRPLIGNFVHHRARVLYLSLEDDYDELRRRVKAAMLHYGVSPD
jgi:hypothetical protein